MSIEQERAIAKKYIGRFPLFMAVWGVAGFSLWVALFPLVHLQYLPLWAGFAISLVILSYCYLPSHEAEHGNIGRPNTRWRWLNEFIGHTSMFPLRIPFQLHRAIHLKHHAYTNNDEKDPDIGMRATSIWSAAYQSWRIRQPDSLGGLTPDVLEDSSEKDQLVWQGFLVTRLWWLLLALLCWTGFALEALLLWWLPMQIAMIYTQITLSWAPHHPMLEQGRYRDTRIWKSPVGTLLSSGMEYHFMHHLFPSIPLNRHPAAYREMKPLLAEAGIRSDNEL
ncbi:beta-carotene hydroxylase [Halieaceae bacterium IMCC14734]|uniref:Beta-carotene hydroxylase n=1 Tax=Candidatus Litorirhabdus singularis TaxID=2518993 RepID=A0ABT3TGC3_9GAMM|nr:fatty acid desaturase [Candidatus Litorirhabdus singularis]MCX2980474.1 beta-carotene hydroxylase [Candidatus Litorirhabdus singularis]